MPATDALLLMIPGPVEVSPAVRNRFAAPPPSHLAPDLIEAFGASLESMRRVWMAENSSQPFVIAGGGTLAMEMAVANLIEPGERAVVVNTGFFSDRLSEMLRRFGSVVREIRAPLGEVPPLPQIEQALEEHGDGDRVKALFATHVDTSTGVVVDPAPIARLARDRGVLSVFDGVCATAAERFEMGRWQADLYLTASQKAIGLPAGLALMVASERALEQRERRRATPPPMYLDWDQWVPIMRAYEERRPAYFSTPATNLVLALEVGLREILDGGGIEARFALHERAARAMRAAWRALELQPVPTREEWTAHSLSALHYPEGVDASLVARVAERGVIVAGGLHPEIRTRYFRVGHMGYAAGRPEMLLRTIRAIADSLQHAAGRGDDDAVSRAAVAAAERALTGA